MNQKILAGILVIIANCLFAANPSMGQQIDWMQDIELAKQKASQTDKYVLIHFGADWCRPCRSLETFVFSSPIVHDAVRKNVVPVKIDVELNAELVKEYGISGVPSDVIITPAGRIVLKRNSPSTINDYSRMLNSLDISVDIEKPGIAREIAQLKEQLQPKTKPVEEHNDFEPDAPSHARPALPQHAAKLARGSQGQVRVLTNPFYGVQKESPVTAQIKINNNDMATRERFNKSAANKPVAPQQSAPTTQVAANSQAKIGSTKQRETIQNNYFDKEMATTSSDFEVAAAGQVEQAATTLGQPEVMQTELASHVETPRKQQVEKNDLEAMAAKMDSELEREAEMLVDEPPVEVVEDRSMFALHGKCPVTLMTESKWINGDKKWGCVHRGRTYLFASKIHLKEFQNDPDKYSPLLAGYDPVIYHEEGRLVEGLEEHGVFMGKPTNQRVILFSTAETRAKFVKSTADSKTYIETVRQAMLSTSSPQNSDTRLR